MATSAKPEAPQKTSSYVPENPMFYRELKKRCEEAISPSQYTTPSLFDIWTDPSFLRVVGQIEMLDYIHKAGLLPKAIYISYGHDVSEIWKQLRDEERESEEPNDRRKILMN